MRISSARRTGSFINSRSVFFHSLVLDFIIPCRYTVCFFVARFGVSQRLFSGYPMPSIYVLSASNFLYLCLYTCLYIYIYLNNNISAPIQIKIYFTQYKKKSHDQAAHDESWSDDECGFARISYPAIKLRLSHHLLMQHRMLYLLLST